jgi:hypothetical protein
MKKWNKNKGIITSILILLVMSPLLVFGQDKNYQGQWSASGEAFENILTLEKKKMRREISTNFHLMVGGNPTILLLSK